MRKRRTYTVDGCAVKSPKTAYLYFSIENRPGLVAKNPDWDVTRQSRELGRMWQQVKADDGDELKKYLGLQEKDKRRYIREKAKAVKETTEVVVQDLPAEQASSPPALEDPAPTAEA